jgi:hypothetical protein
MRQRKNPLTSASISPYYYGFINKKKAKFPWDCDFRLISEHWSIGVLE